MVDSRQALGIDIDNYARTGGTNFDLAAEHIRNGVYDFLIIKAGLGVWKSKTFDEQRRLADRVGIPYLTYHLVDPLSPDENNPKENMILQARRYVDWVGKDQPKYFVDIESPGRHSRIPTRKEMNRYLTELIRLTNGKRPVLYTRMNILSSIGFLKDAESYFLWIAEYIPAKPNRPAKDGKYRYFEDFLEDYRFSLPLTVRGTNLENRVILWQFTDKGSGPYYIYNEFTEDPDFPDGKLSADLNISIKGRDEFLKLIFGRIPDLPKIAPRVQGLTSEQLDKLIQAGIIPSIQANINMDDFEIEEFKTLLGKLEAEGITPDVKVKFLARVAE